MGRTSMGLTHHIIYVILHQEAALSLEIDVQPKKMGPLTALVILLETRITALSWSCCK